MKTKFELHLGTKARQEIFYSTSHTIVTEILSVHKYGQWLCLDAQKDNVAGPYVIKMFEHYPDEMNELPKDFDLPDLAERLVRVLVIDAVLFVKTSGLARTVLGHGDKRVQVNIAREVVSDFTGTIPQIEGIPTLARRLQECDMFRMYGKLYHTVSFDGVELVGREVDDPLHVERFNGPCVHSNEELYTYTCKDRATENTTTYQLAFYLEETRALPTVVNNFPANSQVR